MSIGEEPAAREIRKKLNHPVIDADGHWIEFGPFVREELRRIGGDRAVEGYNRWVAMLERTLLTPVEERQVKRIGVAGWWMFPARNTRDRATAMMPKLLYERLPELGFDFTVLYATAGNHLWKISDRETRLVTCRAFNTFAAEYFRPFSKRMTPAAVIPMHTPEEAIAELEYVVKQLGMKVAGLGSNIPRAIRAETPLQIKASNSGAIVEHGQGYAGGGVWYDALGLDSAYDYDPVWEKCVELGISPTFHGGAIGTGSRSSPTNFVFNHVGHFAAANETVCKALFIGGVTRRFPKLKFCFLEGGVGWACQLFGDLVGHWQKRNPKGLQDVDPGKIDSKMLLDLAQEYAHPRIANALRDPTTALDTVYTPTASQLTSGGELDDLAACKIGRKEQLRDLFVENFYFGCEADDRMNAGAFSRQHNPFNARLRAMFGSDIGHFDVPNMDQVLPEAYELVEDGLLNEVDFREFVFENAVRFYGEGNPDFFGGTAVEAEASVVLRALTKN